MFFPVGHTCRIIFICHILFYSISCGRKGEKVIAFLLPTLVSLHLNCISMYFPSCLIEVNQPSHTPSFD